MARAGKYKFRARAGKYKLKAGAAKYKLRLGARAEGRKIQIPLPSFFFQGVINRTLAEYGLRSCLIFSTYFNLMCYFLPTKSFQGAKHGTLA